MAHIPRDYDLERLNISLAVADEPGERLDRQIETAFGLKHGTGVTADLDRAQALVSELCGLADWKRIMDGALGVLNARGGGADEMPLELLRLLVARLRTQRYAERRDEGEAPVRDNLYDDFREVLARKLREPGMDAESFPNHAEMPVSLSAGHWRHLNQIFGPPPERT